MSASVYYNTLKKKYYAAKKADEKILMSSKACVVFAVDELFMDTNPSNPDEFLQYVRVLVLAREDADEWDRLKENALFLAKIIEEKYPDDKKISMALSILKKENREAVRENFKEAFGIFGAIIISIAISGGLVYFFINHPGVFSFIVILETIKDFFT